MSLSEYEELKKLADSKKDAELFIRIYINKTDLSFLKLGIIPKEPLETIITAHTIDINTKDKLSQEDFETIITFTKKEISTVSDIAQNNLNEVIKEMEKIKNRWWYKLFS